MGPAYMRVRDLAAGERDHPLCAVYSIDSLREETRGRKMKGAKGVKEVRKDKGAETLFRKALDVSNCCLTKETIKSQDQTEFGGYLSLPYSDIFPSEA